MNYRVGRYAIHDRIEPGRAAAIIRIGLSPGADMPIRAYGNPDFLRQGRPDFTAASRAY